MKKDKRFAWLAGGVGCVLLMILACGYSLLYNEGRLVYPMDFAAYVFRPADLPMVLALAVVMAYLLGLFVLLVRSIFRTREQMEQTNTTRKLNPKLGFLGFFGLLGFGGFWTYQVNGSVFPFCSFLFLGFFGFFFEGKLSNVLMDERFRENQARANLNAYRVGYVVIFFLVLLLGHGLFLGSTGLTLAIVTAALALTVALVQFLSMYLLYRYDQADQMDDGEE